MVPWSSTKYSTGQSAVLVNTERTMATKSPPLNGPESAPVLYNPYEEDDDDERCRSCHAHALHTDWSQGDRVCTNCGVVADARLRDTRPEWKDFHEAEDLAKGLPSGARSGLVAVDESKYLGGLQPTTLSKQAFGGDGHGGYGMARIRKRLKVTNRRLDHMMEQIHATALKEAKMDRRIRLKRSRDEQQDYQDDSIRPEIEHLVLQEEEDAHRLHTALYAEKWSLDRALLLYGEAHEQREISDEEREDLLGKLDSTLRNASQNLYSAHSMLSKAANALQLPEKVKTEVAHRLVRFVTRKDGIRIPGVASRLSQESVTDGTLLERKEAARQLKEYNLRKQMAALGAALLFVTARSLGWTRSIAEICSSFQTNDDDKKKKVPALIKAKHVTRAMKEIQSLFPEYNKLPTQQAPGIDASSTPIQDVVATSNFAEHSLRKLELPPVAEASIRTLLIQLRDKQLTSGLFGGIKLPTLCAGIAYLVCSAGSAMQRLAQQHRDSLKSKRTVNHSVASSVPPLKKSRREFETTTNAVKAPTDENCGSSSSDEDDEVLGPKKSVFVTEDNDVPFDVFSHAPIVDDPTEKQEYELKRMWDAWAEQLPWTRSIVELEQSFGITRTVIHDFYKTELYPRRKEVLDSLSDAVKRPHMGIRDPQSLHEAPLASILLVHIFTAASVMAAR